MIKTLHLNLKKKWFDMILSGEKIQEYRDIKDYWILRLFVNYREYFTMQKKRYSNSATISNYNFFKWIF